VLGVSPPPPVRVEVNTVLELKQAVPTPSGTGNSSTTTVDDSVRDSTLFDLLAASAGGATQSGVTIPSGYRLESWGVTGYASNTIVQFANGDWARFLPDVNVLVGVYNLELRRVDPVNLVALLDTNPQGMTVPSFPTWAVKGFVGSNNYPVTTPVTGAVPVSARVATAKECRLHVRLQCVRLPDGLATWQQQTYEAISAAYWELKRQRANEQAAQALGKGVEIKGDSPPRNKEVILDELKRGVVEMLTGANLQGRDAMQLVPDDQPPQVDLDNAISVAEEIQFLEQAFEWENLTYALYPYFWARSKRWPDMADVHLADEEFARFLRSGSARVVVPARPHFEHQVRMYVDFGVLWGGGPAPAVDDPDYLSVAEEIMAQQNPPDDGERRRSWEVRLPTTLVWLDSNSSLPKTNPQPTLQDPPGTKGP
jgi:hypothetical protein